MAALVIPASVAPTANVVSARRSPSKLLDANVVTPALVLTANVAWARKSLPRLALDANAVNLVPALIANVVVRASLLLPLKKSRDAAAPRNLAALFNQCEVY